ncbi:murein biosynthesis integral membrane protein MurJ [Gordonia sp. HY002]|uniref:murein biosynthesis integral membrane protein MurJ n=1 Tax=Gordonia zhenghanii TaxID=2911516 RepID=UPI001EF07288|nr:murein biosynthesis integral membrane protein MurJ [Gordonia zhenghanii]MCF8571724.1 murein biosynthesis integral membrane protein MurJ [Gordonia zhenghanii]MCF8602748.1 murein biosynthesis integral membrane protein MurJ [Gordonia zhenghanii]
MTTEHKKVENPSDESVMRTGGSIAIGTLTSRITGFIRTVLVLAMLGPALSSAFQAAYVLPGMISEVLLGAVLTAIVIPVLVRAEAEDSDGGADFINRIFSLTVVVLGVATVVAIIAAPVLTALNVGDGEVNRDVTTTLAYLLLPEVLFYGLTALFIAILNMKGLFKPGAWAPVLNNVVQITTLVLFFLMPGEISLNPVTMSDPKLLVLGIGTTFGVVAQVAILLPYLRKVGVRLRWKWGIDARLRMFGNMAVAIIGYVLILQVGLMVTYNIAAGASAGGISAYATHWQLLQLPYGVLGVTILTAIMPRMSRNAAADDTEAVVDDMSLATRLTIVALVPVVAFMTFFGPAIGVAIFNFGEFDADTASQVGSVLAWGAFTLIPYAMTLVQLRVFYAREDAWTPTVMVLGITAVKVGSSYLGPVLFDDPSMVVRWLSLSNGLGYAVGAIVGHLLLKKRLGGRAMKNVTRPTLLTIGVSAVVVAAVWAISELTGFARMSTHAGKVGSLVYLIVAAIVALGVVYLLLVALKIPEMVSISNAVMRIVGRFIPRLAPPAIDGDVDSPTMTVQFPRVSNEESFPYAGQVDVRRRFDRGTATWQEYSAFTGGAAGETAVIPVVRSRPAGPPQRRPGPSQPPLRPRGAQPMTGSGSGDEPPRPSTDPTRAMMPKTPPAQQVRGPRLVPGAAVAGGRYRLLEPQGGTRGLAFWRAKDIGLDREVGLTFVDPDQKFPPIAPGQRDPVAEGPQAVLHRTRRLGQLHTAGVARVLDVVRSASGGIVVSEWIPGSRLADVAATGPSATGAARAVRALAAGAEAAHRAGAVLSIDHPDRIRVSTAGDAVLAFPAIMSDDDRRSDVRGLGAVLYALLLGRWTLDGDAGKRLVTSAITTDPVGGMAIAEPDPADPTQPRAPRDAKPDIPFEISAVAARALEGDRGIRTAATVQHVLDQATVVDLQTDMLPRLADAPAPVSVAPISRTRKERLMGEGESGKRNTALLAGGGLFILFVIIAIIVAATNVFGTSDETNADLDSFLPESSSSAPAEPAAPPSSAKPAEPIDVRSVTLLDTSQQPPDSSANLEHILTGEAPGWRTDNYRGSPDFAGLKDGLGLMFRLASPGTVKSVTIETPTPGFNVQLRTTNSRNPTNLDATTQVGSGTVGDKKTTLDVESPDEAQYFVVWMTSLPQGSSGFQAIIDRVSLH